MARCVAPLVLVLCSYNVLTRATAASVAEESGLPELDNLADLLGPANQYGAYLGAWTTANANKKLAKKELEEVKREYDKAKTRVKALMQELKEAEEVLLSAEDKLSSAKRRKKNADKKYLDCVMDMSRNILKAGGKDAEGEAQEEEVPEVVLYSEEDFSGRSFTYDKMDQLFELKLNWPVKSISVASGHLFVSMQGQGNELSYDFTGSLRKLSNHIPYAKKCCDKIRLEESPSSDAVELYDQFNFNGQKTSFHGAGDYDVEFQVQSVRVAAGFRLYLFRGKAQEDYLDMFSHDNAVLGDTNSRPGRPRPLQKVKSIRVKTERPDDLSIRLTIEKRQQSFPTDPGVYVLPQWGNITDISIPKGVQAEFELKHGTRMNAIDGSAPPSNATLIDVKGVCSEDDFCGAHGRCVGPDSCRCKGGFSGDRCTVQFPDGSSSIVCDSVAVFVNEPVACRFIPRKDNVQCTTHSRYIRVYPLHEDSFEIFESPLSKRISWGNPPDIEGDVFPFKVVSNQTGAFSTWADLLILHRPPGTYSTFFQPSLHVLPLPTRWRFVNGSVVFDTAVPSSASIRLETLQHVDVPLAPVARPVTSSFVIQGHVPGQSACLYFEIAGTRRKLGCDSVTLETTVGDGGTVANGEDGEKAKSKADPRVALSFLRLGMWEEALRAATPSRDAEVIAVAQLAMGFVHAARINTRRANATSATFLADCVDNRCPLQALETAYPILPWHSSVPVVLWYEERCSKEDYGACKKFAMHCEEVLHFLPDSAVVTLTLWATILHLTDLHEAKRVLHLALKIATEEWRVKVTELLILVDRKLFQERDDERASGSNSTDDKKKKEEELEVEEDYYDLLGISRTATEQEIKKAYRRLAIKWHPDKNKDPGSAKMFIKIKKAYETLVNVKKRSMYDSGQEVSDEPEPVHFKVVKVDTETNTQTVYWYDPNTGEEGTYTEQIPERESTTARPTARHCCLP
eukprot:GEMP01003399.1.p1 GENE.GEMP01003399.1~~GEMP01003399.1.p1  ORF type:complete len:967 (-),score=226.58 GEMP01003399.1:1480-4380(-)